MHPPEIAESAEARAFEALADGFERARRRPDVDVGRLSFALAGQPATIEVAGGRLFERLVPALAHLAGKGGDGRAPGGAGPPRFAARLWDADATGVRPLTAASGGDPTGRADLAVSPDGRWVVQRRAHAVVAHDRARGEVTGWFSGVDRLPLYDRGRPLHPQILLANQDAGAPPLHAALVARKGRGALLVGAGGSGKSTAALACFLAGFDFLGDDYVSLLRQGDRYVGHGVYSSTFVEPDHLRRFPSLHARAVPPSWPGEDKAVVFLLDVARALPAVGRLARESAIDAMFLPTVGPGPTRVRPASAAEAGLRLVQGGLALAPHAGSAGLPRLFDLAAAVPTFRLTLGPDLAAIPRAIAAALAPASRGGAEAGS